MLNMPLAISVYMCVVEGGLSGNISYQFFYTSLFLKEFYVLGILIFVYTLSFKHVFLNFSFVFSLFFLSHKVYLFIFCNQMYCFFSYCFWIFKSMLRNNLLNSALIAFLIDF